MASRTRPSRRRKAPARSPQTAVHHLAYNAAAGQITPPELAKIRNGLPDENKALNHVPSDVLISTPKSKPKPRNDKGCAGNERNWQLSSGKRRRTDITDLSASSPPSLKSHDVRTLHAAHLVAQLIQSNSPEEKLPTVAEDHDVLMVGTDESDGNVDRSASGDDAAADAADDAAAVALDDTDSDSDDPLHDASPNMKMGATTEMKSESDATSVPAKRARRLPEEMYKSKLAALKSARLQLKSETESLANGGLNVFVSLTRYVLQKTMYATTLLSSARDQERVAGRGAAWEDVSTSHVSLLIDALSGRYKKICRQVVEAYDLPNSDPMKMYRIKKAKSGDDASGPNVDDLRRLNDEAKTRIVNSILEPELAPLWPDMELVFGKSGLQGAKLFNSDSSASTSSKATVAARAGGGGKMAPLLDMMKEQMATSSADVQKYTTSMKDLTEAGHRNHSSIIGKLISTMTAKHDAQKKSVEVSKNTPAAKVLARVFSGPEQASTLEKLQVCFHNSAICSLGDVEAAFEGAVTEGLGWKNVLNDPDNSAVSFIVTRKLRTKLQPAIDAERKAAGVAPAAAPGAH